VSDQQPFIPAWLDDAGLSVLAFRIYCRILRRGELWESKTRLEKEFGVRNRTLAAAFIELLAGGLITEEQQTGKPSIYRPSAARDHLHSARGHHPLVPHGTTTQCPVAPPPSARGHHKGNSKKETPRRDSKKERDTAAPRPFSSDQFSKAWSDWQQHRKEKRKPLTPMTIANQFKSLEAMGEERAIRAIYHSITRGWEGIYEDRHHAGGDLRKPVDVGTRTADYTEV